MRLPLKISVIIPVFNLCDLIGTCLTSCINQNLEDIEIIVVNDGSTDQTPEILREYAKIDNRVIVIDKPNEGVNLARKTGIEASKGEYLFFLDGDDMLPSGSLSGLLKVAKSENADIVAGNVMQFKANAPFKERTYHAFGQGAGISFLEYILMNKLHYLCGKLIRRSIYTNNPISFRKELVVGEDQVQLCQLCLFAGKVVAVDQVVYHYMLNDRSITQRETDPAVLSQRLVMLAESFGDLLQTHHYNDALRQQINFRMIESLHHSLRETGRFVINEKETRKLYYHALRHGILGKKSLLFTHFRIILRAIFSYFSPQLFANCRKMFK